MESGQRGGLQCGTIDPSPGMMGLCGVTLSGEELWEAEDPDFMINGI